MSREIRYEKLYAHCRHTTGQNIQVFAYLLKLFARIGELAENVYALNNNKLLYFSTSSTAFFFHLNHTHNLCTRKEEKEKCRWGKNLIISFDTVVTTDTVT